MQFTDNLDSPGEHRVLLQGGAGQIEAVVSIPDQLHSKTVAFIGHPHSLQGGSMNNKVVTTMARAFKELGIPSVRFNFRGVGESEGTYDGGIGESEDMLALARQWQLKHPDATFIFAGFSFGSYVTYRAAAQFEHALLISIAPPVHHYDYNAFQPTPEPWLIIQGDEDEVVPAELVTQFAQEATTPLTLIHFPDTSHFFHGKLVELRNQLLDYLRPRVNLS